MLLYVLMCMYICCVQAIWCSTWSSTSRRTRFCTRRERTPSRRRRDALFSDELHPPPPHHPLELAHDSHTQLAIHTTLATPSADQWASTRHTTILCPLLSVLFTQSLPDIARASCFILPSHRDTEINALVPSGHNFAVCYYVAICSHSS